MWQRFSVFQEEYVVVSPETGFATGLIKVDSTDDKQHSTARLIKDVFCWDYIAAIAKIGPAFWMMLAISTIATPILNIFCIKS